MAGLIAGLFLFNFFSVALTELIRQKTIDLKRTGDCCGSVNIARIVAAGAYVDASIGYSRQGELNRIAGSVGSVLRAVPEFRGEIVRVIGMENGGAAAG